MSVQAPNAERQIWIYTQMLRVREFEQRVKRTFTDHPGVIRGHTHLARFGAQAIGREIALRAEQDDRERRQGDLLGAVQAVQRPDELLELDG